MLFRSEHITLFIWPDRLPPVFIVSQTVTSATLKWVEEEGCQNLFPSLQFPKLHTLELDSCPLPVDSIYPFIPDSLSITSLFLTDFGFVHDLPVLLRLLPTITHFSFQNSRFCHIRPPGTLLDLFSNLHSIDSRTTLLPCLAHFDMRVQGVDAEIDHGSATCAFVEMVKSRVTENHLEQRLKSVRFSVPDCCLNDELISSLAYLPKVGITISIQDRCGFIL